MNLYFLFLLLPLITLSIEPLLSNDTAPLLLPTMSPTCPCPFTCNNVWRGNGDCDMECNIPECDWDNGACEGVTQLGQCVGNVTIENLNTGGVIQGYCNEWAKTERICENPYYLQIMPPHRIKEYSCKWVLNIHGRKLPSLETCHSLIPCTSDAWCQQDCTYRVRDFSNKCAWGVPNTKNPTPFPTQFPTQFPTGFPSKRPTPFPTGFPSKRPTGFPTPITLKPTPFPTKKKRKPTKKPTPFPSPFPSEYPSPFPTHLPSIIPPTLHPTNTPFIPNPPHPPHSIIIHHHDGDDNNNNGMNKYDMAIAGIVICGLVLIIGGIFWYKKKMVKYRICEERERRARNIRLASHIELSNYRIPNRVEPILMGKALKAIPENSSE
jgi:hypothetical protein